MENIEYMQICGKVKEVNCRNGEKLYSVEWIDTDTITMVLEQKIKNKWYYLHITTKTNEIYKRLTEELIAKKLNSCTYIKSIKRSPLYNGFQRIYVTYDNNIRATYTIKQD